MQTEIFSMKRDNTTIQLYNMYRHDYDFLNKIKKKCTKIPLNLYFRKILKQTVEYKKKLNP